MRLPLIAGNWKMHTTVAEARALAAAIRDRLAGLTAVETVLCPPFISIPTVATVVAGTPLLVGAQNMHDQDKGAFTGEISPVMLVPFCRYVILGHSERRQYFGESDEFINRKVRAALRHGLCPILCVGENLAQREAGQTMAVVLSQLHAALAGVDQVDGLVIAYEPVWAIGTGRPATGADANAVIGLIRQTLADRYGAAVAASLRLLYGGSVTAANIAEFVAQPEIDGALVGGASLRADEFAAIVQTTAQVKQAGRL